MTFNFSSIMVAATLFVQAANTFRLSFQKTTIFLSHIDKMKKLAIGVAVIIGVLFLLMSRNKTPIRVTNNEMPMKMPRFMQVPKFTRPPPRPVRLDDQCGEGQVLKDSKCEPAVVEESVVEEPVEEVAAVVEEPEKPVEEKGTCQCREKRYADMDIQFGQDGYACILDREKNVHASRALCEDLKTKKRCLEESTSMKGSDGNPIGEYCKWVPE